MERFFYIQAEDGILARDVTGVQTCALPICRRLLRCLPRRRRWRGPGQATGVAWYAEGTSSRGCPPRSEERRVGKECGARCGAEREKENADEPTLACGTCSAAASLVVGTGAA